MGRHLPVLCISLCCLWTQAACAISGMSAVLVPDEVRPGDLFRLEVVRSDREFAEFELLVPHYERLHLVGTESSPVIMEDGCYIQKESWVFQADASGEILMQGITARLIPGSRETTVELPALRLAVIPYPEKDPEPQPLDWEKLDDTEAASLFRVYGVITLLLGAAVIVYLYARNRKSTSEEPVADSLLERTIADLEQGCLNADSLHILFERNGDSFSTELKLEIEQAIYANRGNPTRLAASLRKETR